MKIGTYDIPDIRLFPTSVDTLSEIYKVKKREKIPSKDLAILLGFKYGTEPHYYRKIHALQAYGLLDGKGIFQISELGEKILHPRDGHEQAVATTKSVLNVPLWKEIYKKQGKKPRDDNFWAVLVDITKADPATSKSNAVKILGWYEADIGHISDNLVDQEISSTTPSTETLRSSNTQDNQMSQQMESSSNMQTISFDKYKVSLPKGDLVKEWEKLKKYMEIKLEDYKSEQQSQE